MEPKVLGYFEEETPNKKEKKKRAKFACLTVLYTDSTLYTQIWKVL